MTDICKHCGRPLTFRVVELPHLDVCIATYGCAPCCIVLQMKFTTPTEDKDTMCEYIKKRMMEE